MHGNASAFVVPIRYASKGLPHSTMRSSCARDQLARRSASYSSFGQWGMYTNVRLDSG